MYAFKALLQEFYSDFKTQFYLMQKQHQSNKNEFLNRYIVHKLPSLTKQLFLFAHVPVHMQRLFFMIVFIPVLGYYNSYSHRLEGLVEIIAKREEKRVAPKFSKRRWSPARPVGLEPESCSGSKAVFQNSEDFLIFTLMLRHLRRSATLCAFASFHLFLFSSRSPG